MHTKSRWARRPFDLTTWQRNDIIAPLFGDVEWSPVAKDYVRRHRVAWIELARKNGKSELLAGMALILLVADDEEGAEVYGAAVDRDQASIVWQVAERMVTLSPTLSRRLRIFRNPKRIADERTGSFYQVLAGDALGNLGLNPHGVVFDEVHAQKSADLWNALRTSMGTRTQPLMVAATTAGNDPASFAATEHEYSVAVAADRGARAVLNELLRELGVLREDVFFIEEPAGLAGAAARTRTAPARAGVERGLGHEALHLRIVVNVFLRVVVVLTERPAV